MEKDTAVKKDAIGKKEALGKKKGGAKRKAAGNQWYYLLPLMFIVIVVPLIVYMKIVPLTGASYQFWNGAVENPDFFSYYKGLWLTIAAALGLALYALSSYRRQSLQIEKDLSPYYIAAGVYLLLILLSTLLAEYKDIAIGGFPDRYEGAIVLVSYLVVFFLTTIFATSEKEVRLMLKSLMIGAIFLGLIGLFQYLGYDLWKTDFGKALMLPSQYESMADGLQFSFSKHTIYSSLYHTDFVGSYMGMLFPLTFALFILVKDRRTKVVLALVTLLMAFNWLGCNSRAGMVGGGLAILAFLVLINKVIIRYWKFFAIGIVVALTIFIGLNQMSKGYLGARVNSLFKDATVLIGLSESTQPNSADIPLKDFSIEGNSAKLVTSTETLHVTLGQDNLIFKDENQTQLTYEYNKADQKITLNDPRYQSYALKVGDLNGKMALYVQRDLITLYIHLDPSGFVLIDNKGYPVAIKPIESWGFEGKERLGSSRGYIWSRSIPLLKETLLVGYGPDTFAAYFPQNDFKGKIFAYGDMWHLVDKPHNLYLQIGINTGVISLIAFLALIGFYFVRSIRIYFFNGFEELLPQIGVSIFVAIVGYLGAAFFNDSIVSVAPVFWILLALGVSVNHLVGKTSQ